MLQACSTCGISYPSTFNTCTCRVCGGLIENADKVPKLSYTRYLYDEIWYKWREKYLSAPPRPLTEQEWLKTCSTFNGCALCGLESIDERLLVIPTRLKGKLYTYNTIPTCSRCAKLIRDSQTGNPLLPFYKNYEYNIIQRMLAYLESNMLSCIFEEFDFEADSIEIICTIKEDTSVLPFNGIYARKVFGNKPLSISKTKSSIFTGKEEAMGVSWRLLDE